MDRPKMVYDWKTGARIKGDAQASGELFEKLSHTEEGLTAETLLNANKPKSAPLHDDYEWDNEIAGEKWRLHQSNHFLNSLTICLVSAETNESVQTRAVHITTEPHKYEPITEIVQVQSKYECLLSNALSELQAFQRKYNTLKELTPVFQAITEVVNNE